MPYSDGDYRLDLHFIIPNGEEASVVRHVEWITTPSVADVQAVLDAIANWWSVDDGPVSRARTSFSAQTILVDVTATSLGALPPVQVVESINVAGLDTGDAAPPESALVTTWYTGIPGRRYRGRSFWPGYGPDGLNSQGLFDASALAVYNAQFQRLFEDINATDPGNVFFGVNSRLLEEITPISSVTARQIPHHQSRRNN